MHEYRADRSILIAAFFLSVLMAAPLSSPHAFVQQAEPSEILRRAASNGEATCASFDRLTRFEELTIQAVGVGNNVTGEYYRLSRVFRDRSDRAAERVLEEKSKLGGDGFFSIAAVRRMLQIYRFNITREALEQYDFNYIGRERIDEVNTFVFDLKPKDKYLVRQGSDSRFVKGQVWIDDQDMQVVKVAGEIVPHSRPNRTPRFETYFKNYDKYWVPAYTYADEDLRIGDETARVIIKVREYGFAKTAQP